MFSGTLNTLLDVLFCADCTVTEKYESWRRTAKMTQKLAHEFHGGVPAKLPNMGHVTQLAAVIFQMPNIEPKC